MQNQNQKQCDLIESYLKNVIQEWTVEIRRSEIADQFNCVLPKLLMWLIPLLRFNKGMLKVNVGGGVLYPYYE